MTPTMRISDTTPPMGGGPRYTFDNDTPEAVRQLDLLAEILDGHSTGVLSELDIQPGWRCLDVGAGAGSISDWLAERVGATGRVTAMDLKPRYTPASDIVDVRAGDDGDVRTADLPTDRFDLIHARLVLMHLPDRAAVLRRLAGALRPGGILVLSEWDCTGTADMLLRAPMPQATQAFTAFHNGLLDLAVGNGASLDWARRVPLAMLDAGLINVGSQTHNQLWTGGEAGCLLHASNSRQMRAPLLAHGVSVEQLDTLHEAMHDPQTLAWSYPMFTTIGRRDRV